VLNVNEAIRAVEAGFVDQNFKSASRRAVAAEMFYKPGTATDRAVTETCDVLELESIVAS
jgi:hypothetical protein